MKMIYISLQLLMWVYRKTDFMISTILFDISHSNCTKASLYKGSFFPKCCYKVPFLPNSRPFPLISVILYHYTRKKF